MTSSCACSASPSTTPCARSPASNRAAPRWRRTVTTPVRWGTAPSVKTGPCDPSVGSRCRRAPYDASPAKDRCHGKIGGLRWQCGNPPGKSRLYDRSAVQIPRRPSKLGKCPALSHPYDQSAAIWPQNTMPVRSTAQNPYDAKSGKSTIREKSVTSKSNPGTSEHPHGHAAVTTRTKRCHTSAAKLPAS